MKKVIITSLLLISVTHFSQILSNFRFGLTASANYTGIRGVHNPSNQKFGYNLGLVGSFEIRNLDNFYFQPQIEFVNAGEKGEGSTLYTNNYLNIPLNIKAFFSEAESEFYVTLGPRIGFLIYQNVVDESDKRYRINEQGKANIIDLAIAGGIGYSYKRKHEISAKIDVGLSDVYKNLDDSGYDPAAAARNTQSIISIGYTYFFD